MYPSSPYGYPKTIWNHNNKLVYCFNLLSPLDLLSLPTMLTWMNDKGLSKAQFVKELHEKARIHMEKKEEQYVKNANEGKKEVIFKEGDLVWVHLRKERYLNPKFEVKFSSSKEEWCIRGSLARDFANPLSVGLDCESNDLETPPLYHPYFDPFPWLELRHGEH
ncbi:hypothetical protein CR513_30986, partial [Mucuna pruriens]